MQASPGRAQRPAAIAFAILLVATAAAFLLANRLKAADAEIDVIKRTPSFSPNDDGRRDREVILFRIDERDSAAVDIVDADGARVRRVREKVQLRRNRRLKVVWDGRDDDGRRAPDGEYRMRLILGQGRSLLAPRPFVLDTVPPEAAVLVDEGTPIVAPGADVRFSVSGETDAGLAPTFTVVRTDLAAPREIRTLEGVAGITDYTWDGRTSRGVPAAPGTYVIAVTAYDRAKNEASTPSLPLELGSGSLPGRPGVTVRRLALQPPVRAVRAGELANVRVDARGKRFTWALRRIGQPSVLERGLRAVGKTNVLLRVPRGSSGLYMLTVEAGGATARAPIAVRSGARTGLLVVLPMVSWLGLDPVDQTQDGVPDTFATGAEVRFPRPFVFPDGVPPYFGGGVTPLLEYLDREEIDYDLVTDLDLAFGGEPTPSQDGVLMPASAQWTSRPVARRLRKYVEAGGRVALFGPRALTGSVTIADAVLSRPSPTTDADALGGRLAEVRDLAPGTGLTVIAEDPELGLLEGFSGSLTGFTRVEELNNPGSGELLAGVGEETTELKPALSAVGLGDGVVIRVGLPEWGSRLDAGWAAPEQLTANIVDILRGLEPRVRTARG